MKDEKIDIIIGLLRKSWLGTLTSAEKKELSALLSQNSFEQLKCDLENDAYVLEHFKKYSKYNAEVDFKSFLKVVREPRQIKRKIQQEWGRWVCAASLILFMLGGLLYYELGRKEEVHIVKQEESEKKINVARVIFPDEGVVTLDQEDESLRLDSLGILFSRGLRVLDYTRVKTTDIESAYHTLVVPKGCLYKIVLNDGTKVSLNADSKMKYPVVFDSICRKVYLEGEAYFDVVKDEELPFYVEGRDFTVRVLGTSFNVMNYEDEKRADVTLVSGRIEMNVKDTSVYMMPGNQVIIKSGEIVEMRKVDVKPYISWMEDKFCFENERLELILRKLSRWYDVKIVCDNSTIGNIRFSGYVPNDIGIKEVLELLEETTDIEFVEYGGFFHVRHVKN